MFQTVTISFSMHRMVEKKSVIFCCLPAQAYVFSSNSSNYSSARCSCSYFRSRTRFRCGTSTLRWQRTVSVRSDRVLWTSRRELFAPLAGLWWRPSQARSSTSIGSSSILELSCGPFSWLGSNRNICTRRIWKKSEKRIEFEFIV